MTREEAEKLVYKSKWKVYSFPAYMNMHLYAIIPEEPIEYDMHGLPSNYTIQSGLTKELAEYLVKLHNDTLATNIFDDRIDEWHNNNNIDGSLHEFLDLTLEEYNIWLLNPEVIERKYR